MTADITETGDKFKNVPNVIIVYISRKDIFKPHPVGRPKKNADNSRWKSIYHVDRVVRELNEKVYNGLTEIYVNAESYDGSDVAELMKVLSEKNTYNDKFPITSARKYLIKTTERDVSIMSDEMRAYIDKKISKQQNKQNLK